MASGRLIDPELIDEVFDDLAKEEPEKWGKNKSFSIKIKEPAPKQSKPGNWKESEVEGDLPRNAPPPEREESPLINPIDIKLAAAFSSGRPATDSLDVVQCKHCKKPVLRHVAPGHIKKCLEKKQAKVQKKKEAKEAKDAAARRAAGLPSEDESPEKSKPGARKSAIKELDGDSKKGKKRKAEEAAAEKAPKKKKKDEPKAKLPKQKAPVDVEKQCGVPLPNGALCARSLTCKSHSMGAKRGVPGRSAPYDILLAAYQKKNQARQQRAFIDANAPVDDFEENGAIDSDEEKEAVMAALARAHPKPMATHVVTDIKQTYQHFRMKQALMEALSGHRGSSLFAVTPRPSADLLDGGPRTGSVFGADGNGGFGMNGLPSAGLDSNFDVSRRSSIAPVARQGSMAAPARKASVAGV